MAITQAERHTRRFIESIYSTLAPTSVTDHDTIFLSAFRLFLKTLLPKLRNLQQGESLQLTMRVDIVGANGIVRGGRGALRNMPEYRVWRTAVFDRDAYACQECGARGQLNAHHLLAWEHYPALRFDVANGQTLCQPCHAKKHPHLQLLQRKGERHGQNGPPSSAWHQTDA